MAKNYKTQSGRTISQTFAMLGEQAIPALGAELYREGSNILSASQPLVPVDTGALRGSGYVTEPQRDGNRVSVRVGYGGVASMINPKTGVRAGNYAIFVHENLEAHHNVGMAKYLEIPFNEAVPGMADRILRGTVTRLFTSFGRTMSTAMNDLPEEEA